MNKDIFKSDGDLLKTIDSFFDDQLDSFRLMNEQIIWRNLLYYEGEQYIEFLRSTKSFRRRSIPDFVPTPVSNDIREHVRSTKAMRMNQKTIPRVWPNSNDKEDEHAADVGQFVIVSLNHADGGAFFNQVEKLCIWLPISGTAFMRTYPDADGGLWMPNAGKTGDVGRECILPFSVRLDTLGDDLSKKRWVGVESLRDKEWVEDTFKVKIKTTGNQKAYVDYQKSLAKLIGNVSPWKGQNIVTQSFDVDSDDLVIFREVEFKPTFKYPLGKYVTVCNGQVLQNIDRLPILPKDGKWYYTLTDFHDNYVPGRFWSSGSINDLISPQNTVNQIDQSLAINRLGMGKPKIFTAGDVGLKQIGTAGHGFIQISFNPIMGQKPSFEQGTPLPQQVLEERSLQKKQFQDASGDPKNVLKGEAPSANASGVMTDSLRETAEIGKAPDLDRFNRSMSLEHKKTLIVAQEVMTEQRIFKMMGRGNKVKIMRFKGSDLHGNDDVRLEPDSGLITSKTGQRETLVNLVQAGFFQDETVDPNMRQEVLTRLGMSGFSKQINTDVERAELENSAMASGEGSVFTATVDKETGEEQIVTDDPIFELDRHTDHFETHRKFIIGPEFKELEQERQVVFLIHSDCHQRRIQATPPDIRDYVQIDKLLAANVLTVSERAQVLDKYMGIKAGDETELGIPTADVVVKAKQKTMDTDKKEETKQDQMENDLIKHTMTEGVKVSALQAQKEQKEKAGGSDG